MKESLKTLLAAAGLAMTVAPALAETSYPTKPIKFIVPFAPGGGGDGIAVTFLDELSQVLGQPIVKENHGGGNSVIGTNMIATAPADGYTMGVVTTGFVTNPYLYQSLPYESDDFTVVAMIADYPFFLAARSDFPGDTVADIIKYAKENPGKLTSANSGRGAGAEFATGLFGALAGIDIKGVPFQGSGPGLTAVAGGFVDVIFSSMTTIQPFVDGGKMKVLGSTGKTGVPEKGIEPIAALGVPDYEFSQWWALIVPKGTPDDVVAKLNGAMQEVLAMDTVKPRLERLQANILVGPVGSADEYLARQDAQTRTIVEYLGLKPE